MQIDDMKYEGRYLRTHTGKALLGPTGARLFADYLDLAPGFCGRLDFIHKLNITQLFTIKTAPQICFDSAKTVWRPAYLSMSLETERVSFHEIKYITWDDCAVSLQTWRNLSDAQLCLSLDVRAEKCETRIDAASGCALLSVPGTVHGIACTVAVATGAGLERGSITLRPGETAELVIAAAAGNAAVEQTADIIARAKAHMLPAHTLLQAQEREYARFFDGAPAFFSSDPVLDKAWEYRWFIQRHGLAKPDFGNLQGYCMYEGRSHKTSKEPLAAKGWEFSKLINLSTPLHLTDMRWHRDRELCRGMIRNMIANRDENGLFCTAYVDSHLAAYANYGVWAVYLFYLVDGDDGFIKEILPGLKEYMLAETRVHGADDGLQIETVHQRTGKEYQPGYWYFHGFNKDPKDKAYYTPLKRVDRSVYHYLNLCGISRLCKAAGEDAQAYDEECALVAKSVREKMWDDKSGFYYDLHYMTDEKALVKHIVGIYPYWANMAGWEQGAGLEKLFDEALFNTPMPFPSVAKDCPVYCQAGGWQGNFIKGRDGCVWDGPQWPYTTGIAIDAIGAQSREHGHMYDERFAYFLHKYALSHFRDYDIDRPYLVEHYNPETGEPLSDEPDYNHSYFIDLVINYVCGVIPGKCPAFDPLDCGLDYYSLSGINIRGHMYDVTYRKKGCTAPRALALDEGYHVARDGVRIL